MTLRHNRRLALALRVRMTALAVLCMAVVAAGALVLDPDHGGSLAPRAAALTAAPAYRTIFGDQEPQGRMRSRPVSKPLVVGTRFVVGAAGTVHGARFWKVPGGAGRHVVGLWGPRGIRLATARVVGESRSGWQQVLFKKPVRVRTGRTYVVGYRSKRGDYAVTPRYRGRTATGVISLAGRRSGVTGPRRTRTHHQFWVDALFVEGGKRSSTPSPGATQDPTQMTAPVPAQPSVPAVTGTASPAPNAACKEVPSVCGYPDATNTGPAAGTVFVQVPSQATSGAGWAWNARYNAIFVKGSGAVLEALDIAGSVVIDAPNVTLRNSRVAACGGSDDSDVVAIRYRPQDGLLASGAQVLHNQINGSPTGCGRRARSGVRDVYGAAPGVLVDGNNVYGAGNGITIEHEGVVANNWVHTLGHEAGDHHSGISTHGGAIQVSFLHNTVLLHGQKFAGGGGISGALTVYSDFAHAQNVTLRDNFVSGGSYVIYGGNSGDGYTTPATNIKISGNRFACGDWLYGPVAAFDPRSAGNEWTGNYCDGTGVAVRP